jgi:D-glycero-D-manno-heptose 1,7-bisphosphate phosphatase
MALSCPRRFTVLDRDGTVIALRPYLSDPNGVVLLEGVPQALRRLQELGLGLILVTNQSAVGRGIIDEERLGQIHARMNMLLAAESIQLDAIYVCTHTPSDDCDCRKPKPGMLYQAAADFGFQLNECFVIGDNISDIKLGQGVGATTFLVRTGYGAEVETSGGTNPDYVVDNLRAASTQIEALLHGVAPQKRLT